MSADLLVSPVLRCFFSGFPPSVKSTPTVHLKAVIRGQLLQYMAAAEGAFNMPFYLKMLCSQVHNSAVLDLAYCICIMSRIIQTSVNVIHLSLLLQQITLTSARQ